jgi:hypothetical protein
LLFFISADFRFDFPPHMLTVISPARPAMRLAMEHLPGPRTLELSLAVSSLRIDNQLDTAFYEVLLLHKKPEGDESDFAAASIVLGGFERYGAGGVFFFLCTCSCVKWLKIELSEGEMYCSSAVQRCLRNN